MKNIIQNVVISGSHEIGLFVRGGEIMPSMPLKENQQTTAAQQQNNFDILIALDHTGSAKGSLYWDDGADIDPLLTGNYETFEFQF